MATSTQVKYRYNKKTYTEWRTPLRNEVFAEVENIRKKEGLSRAEFLKKIIKEVYYDVER